MAAHRHGILEAIMPRENEKDLPDIPDAIKKTMKQHFVDSMDEVLKIALEREIVALPIPPATGVDVAQPVEEPPAPHKRSATRILGFVPRYARFRLGPVSSRLFTAVLTQRTTNRPRGRTLATDRRSRPRLRDRAARRQKVRG